MRQTLTNDRETIVVHSARDLAHYAAMRIELDVGSAEAIKYFAQLIQDMAEHDIPAPDPMLSSEVH
jgi:hypothetical protein